MNCIIQCIFRIFSISFSASHTQLSFMSRLSPASSPIRLSSPAPSPVSSPTLYPTHQHSTTPTNTLLTLRHPHSHQADINQSSHIIHPSLSISHHPTASFHFQSTDLQTSASTSLPSTPLRNHSISTSRSPLLIICTYASHQTLPQKSMTHTPPNLPIHTTPITTPTLPTTPFPLPYQQTYSSMMKMIIKSQIGRASCRERV